MEAILTISSAKISEESLQELTIYLCQDIIKEADIDAKLVEGLSQEGAKGEPITIGLIVLSLIKVGTVAAFLNVVRSYFEREPSLMMALRRNDGAELSITMKDLSREQIDEMLKMVKDFMVWQ